MSDVFWTPYARLIYIPFTSRGYVNYMHDPGGLFLLCLAWICVFFAQLRVFGFQIGSIKADLYPVPCQTSKI